MGQPRIKPNQYALLIGIDYYIAGSLPDGSYYPSLSGCVRDIIHVDEFLRSRLGVPEEQILKLTASNAGAPKPPERCDTWPTYENIVAAFQRLTERAQPGDRVYVHYSGHGGRTKTLIPERKGPHGIDEALVPTDIHNSTARYLRDVELGPLLQRMVERGLHLAVVLDSCHSGGAVRGQGDVAVRGLGVVDETPRPQESMVAAKQDLAALWDHLTERGTRNVTLGSGWLPEPKGYVLLAACKPTESAFEYAFNGRERNGVLTYWLLDALYKYGPDLSGKLLHERIIAQIHSQFEKQTPQLQGEGQNTLFGADHTPTLEAATVQQVDPATERVRLASVGETFGSRKGAQFAIYLCGTTAFVDVSRRQAIVTLTEVAATDAWAAITTRLSEAPIEPGSPALLLDQGSLKLVRKVGFVQRTDLPPGIDQDAALAAVKATLVGNPWVAAATADDTLEYQVAVSAAGAYEIWDPAGMPIANLRPSLSIEAPDAAAAVVQRLVHLTKYHVAKQLDNHDPQSPLARKLVVELAGFQEEYDLGEPPEPRPLTEPGNTPVVPTGWWTFLRIRNEANQPLNVAVLDLQPDWGITQIYPSGSGDWFVQIEPGREELLPLHADLPEGYEEGTDLLKVFATLGAANFRRLELPALDQPATRSATQRASATHGERNPLEELMDAITGEQPPSLPTRNLTPAALSRGSWMTVSTASPDTVHLSQ